MVKHLTTSYVTSHKSQISSQPSQLKLGNTNDGCEVLDVLDLDPSAGFGPGVVLQKYQSVQVTGAFLVTGRIWRLESGNEVGYACLHGAHFPTPSKCPSSLTC